MKKLNSHFPTVIPKYEFVFSLRFDLLVYRARLVWISDSLRLAQYLAGLEDSSNEVQRLADILRGNAIAEAFRYIAYSEQSIASASTAPCLEVELRLVQNMIKKLAESGLRELPEDSELRRTVGSVQKKTCMDVVLREPNRRERGWNAGARREKLLVLSSSFTKGPSANSLEAAMTLCKEYPSTAGRFLSIATALKADDVHRDPTNLARMYTIATRLVEKAWASHQLGQLQTCQNGHAYSGGSFPEGCPECGRKLELPDVEFSRNAKFLQEDKFLQQMMMMRCGPI
jgi:rubrerythrin